MNRVLVAVSLLLPFLSLAEVRAEVKPPAGFAALFNGQDLTGWVAMPHFDPRKLAAMSDEERSQQLAKWMEDARQHWTVENGELVNDGKGPYLTTERDYGDIELLLEYKTVPKADSGVYLRGTPQVQIWDYTREGGKWNRGADLGSGGLFNNTLGSTAKEPIVLADKPFGEWNQMRVVQLGARTSVWLNEQLVVDHAVMENFWDRSRPLFATGPIQLQTHGGEIRWRNLFVREIPADEANKLLSSRDTDGFVSIFNGRDFEGWTGAVDNYQVVDGTIVCRPGKGGDLYTEEIYDDFVVRMEFQLPPGGNNGLSLRYPGHGQSYQTGMCEIQILDSEHPKYANLDPRQYHGSAYGMVPAHRGYLRPTGEWNYQETTVKGSKIKVELNGSVILDADLSTVTEFMGDKPYAGRTRTSGHFGLAGHNDPVAFRNLTIRKLPPLEAVANWPQFRGPNGAGRVDEPIGLPAKIGPEENVVWKTELPGGHSSPVIFGDRIYVTASRGEQLSTIALDRGTGKILWEQEAPHRGLEKIHQIGSHAQSSPATDGERVVSFFGSAGLFCYDTSGQLLWQRPLGPFNNTFGAASSPIIVDDRVILCQDHDTDSFLIALDKHTGDLLWETDRSEFPRNYCTPIIWEVDGKKQIVVAATLRVVGYDFDTGEELWTVYGLSRAVCMTPVIGDDNTLYVAGWSQGGDETERISIPPFDDMLKERDANKNGTLEESELEKGDDIQRRFDQIDRDKSGSITREEYDYYRRLFDDARNAVIAIKPGGQGDLTKTNVVWDSRKFVPFCSSPLYYNGYIFTVKDGGIVTNYNARTGELLQTKRAAGNGNYYSSPIGADGRVFLFDQRGIMSILSAYAEWKVLESADFGEEIYATPAIADDRMYVRTAGHLYCFGK
jgi:outer membrane protein assembly factor BamB